MGGAIIEVTFQSTKRSDLIWSLYFSTHTGPLELMLSVPVLTTVQVKARPILSYDTGHTHV